MEQDSHVVPSERVMRVFVSSSFQDMQAERDELVKQIFPQLRKMCENRGVIWDAVDFRWGITDEQSAEGKVLPICLAEVHRCRPYFIGMLGERYGRAPKISADLIEREPWLNNAPHGGSLQTAVSDAPSDPATPCTLAVGASDTALAFALAFLANFRIADFHVSQSQEENVRSLGTLARACV